MTPEQKCVSLEKQFKNVPYYEPDGHRLRGHIVKKFGRKSYVYGTQVWYLCETCGSYL